MELTLTPEQEAKLLKERLENKAASAKLRKLIMAITKELSLDEESMHNRIDKARSGEYGGINGLINLLVAIAKWPVNQGEGAMVSTNRMILEDKFNIDLDLMQDIANCRGYHSFVSDDNVLIEGQEPDYAYYQAMCKFFLQDLDITSSKTGLDPKKWNRKESASRLAADEELTRNRAEIDRYNNEKLLARANA